MSKNILVTGGCGFIGSNFLNKYVPLYPDYNFINLDILSYASDLDNLNITELSNYHFYEGDIGDKDFVKEIFDNHNISDVINFAAETHVDISITNPELFPRTNILGTQNLLDIARHISKEGNRFVNISTDEVYGHLGVDDEAFTETTILEPNSPYSASKAGCDLLCRSYVKTFDMNIVTTRCSNNYGPNQDPTKLIPKIILNATGDKNIPIYGKGDNIRDWLYVEDHCDAIWTVFEKGKKGEIYNIGTNNELTNLELTKQILELMGKPDSLIEFVADRKGHDFRYGINSSKIQKELGWKPQIHFEQGIQKTISWYNEYL